MTADRNCDLTQIKDTGITIEELIAVPAVGELDIHFGQHGVANRRQRDYIQFPR
jgi:hypothetical protein